MHKGFCTLLKGAILGLLLGGLLSSGCGGGSEPAGDLVEIERVTEISGTIEVERPGEESLTLNEGGIYLRPGSVLEVREGICVAYLGGTRITLAKGHRARIIPPLTEVDSILAHPGSFRAISPGGEEVLVEGEDDLPPLAAGTIIFVASGEVMVYSEGLRSVLGQGEVARLRRPLGVSPDLENLLPQLPATPVRERTPASAAPGTAPTLPPRPASPYLPGTNG